MTTAAAKPPPEAALEAALAGIDEPDLAIRVAYQLHDDRKAVLAHGADLAIMLRSKVAAAAAYWPTELEPILTWGHRDRFRSDLQHLRAGVFGFTVAQVSLDGLGDPWSSAKARELSKRIAAIAATGHSNAWSQSSR